MCATIKHKNYKGEGIKTNMFRKLVSNLSYSPSLIGEVAKLARSLKREEQLRRSGLLFLGLALLLNTFALLMPPESANTASSYDMVYGGVRSTDELLAQYDKNEANIRDILESFGITRKELAVVHPTTIDSKNDKLLLASRKPHGATHASDTVINYAKKTPDTSPLYFTSIRTLDTTPYAREYGSRHKVFQGTSDTLGEFAILQSSGALVVQQIPDSLKNTETPAIATSKKAYNNTRHVAAHTVMARASDRLTYTLIAKNTSDATTSFTFSEYVDDILEYADIVDAHGGSLDLQEKTITWPARELAPNESVQQHFVVRLKTHLPATAQGISNPHSYDCLLTNTFGNTTQTALMCPPAKLVESLATQLPNSSAKLNITVGVAIFAAALYLYLRTSQQKEEVRLIRRDANEGLLG